MIFDEVWSVPEPGPAAIIKGILNGDCTAFNCSSFNLYGKTMLFSGTGICDCTKFSIFCTIGVVDSGSGVELLSLVEFEISLCDGVFIAGGVDVIITGKLVSFCEFFSSFLLLGAVLLCTLFTGGVEFDF